MINVEIMKEFSKEEKLKYLLILCEGQLASEDDMVANLSNISAMIKASFDDCNWAGFYIIKGNELVLGPFQGLPACNRIDIGRGVCGTAVLEKRVLRVPDVHEFKGHIACDGATKSEIVIPIVKNDEVIAVLDMDSPILDRFSYMEEEYLKKLVSKIESHI